MCKERFFFLLSPGPDSLKLNNHFLAVGGGVGELIPAACGQEDEQPLTLCPSAANLL